MNIEKIKRDKYFNKIFTGDNYNELIDAGYFEDSVETINYDLKCMNTNFSNLKSISNDKKNIVLLATGAFSPLHDGHINMMKLAEYKLNLLNYNVIGIYFSPCHQSYIDIKDNCKLDLSSRIRYIQSKLNQQPKHYLIDFWECMHLESTVNFTEVLNRLELYLNYHLKTDIEVVFVNGEDNIGFSNVFKDKLHVCVQRNNSIDRELINNCKNNNMIYIEDNKFSHLASSKMKRNIEANYKINVKNYIIRDEGELSLNYLNIENVKIYQNEFLHQFISLIKKYTDYNINVLNVNEQLNQLSKHIKPINKTVSLDKYYKGDYNIDCSRVFDISTLQSRYRNISIKNYENIKEDNLTLIDDDSITGSTINSVTEILKNKNISYLFLNELFNVQCDDIIDIRDFIIGSQYGGLKVFFNDNEIRVPYIYPFVNLESRASLSINYNKQISKEIIDLNISLYKNMKNISVSNLMHNEIFVFLGYENYTVYDMLVDLRRMYD